MWLRVFPGSLEMDSPVLSVRFFFGLCLWLDLHFLPVYACCSLGTCILKKNSSVLLYFAILAYVPVQYARIQAGLNAARRQTCFGLITLAVLGIPVFLTQLFLLRSADRASVYVDMALGISSFVFSVLETVLAVLFFLRMRIGKLSTVVSSLQWLIIFLSTGVLLFALIYYLFILSRALTSLDHDC